MAEAVLNRALFDPTATLLALMSGARPSCPWRSPPLRGHVHEIAEHGHVLTPGRYVGAEELEDDDEPFEEKMKRLTAKLDEQFKESAKLEKAIRANMEELGYGT